MRTMSKALAINPDIDLEDILRVSAGNDFDVVYNPMLQGPGNIQGGTFIKPAPVHEGASTQFARNGGDPSDLPGDVDVSPLEEFEGNFEAELEGDGEGMSVLKKNNGETVLTSYRNARAAEFAGNGEAMTNSGVGLNQAIDMYTRETGDQLQLSTIY